MGTLGTRRNWLRSFTILLLLLLPLFLIAAYNNTSSSPCHPVSLSPCQLYQLPPPVPAVASYQIDVTLDTAAKTLDAQQTITYTNRTEQPIPDLVFHLYLNAFQPGSLFDQEGGMSLRGFGWDPDYPGRIEISDLRLADGTPLSIEQLEDGTLARAPLPTPVAPGESVIVHLSFAAQLPKVFARTGFAGDFFMVGQWFPKLGVWEEGAWNAYPFHANSEFYADFGTYDVAITLPADYVTGATGLPTGQTDNGDGSQTIRYHAETVIDFAWTAAPTFQTVTREVGEVELLYLVLPEHEWTVERVMDTAEAALTYYSQWYGPYAYPRLTIVDVPDDGSGAGGMEYPSLITAGALDPTGLGLTGNSALLFLETVVAHEVGHQWWQSMVATNEAEEPWMDEGMTDYTTLRLMDEVYGPNASFGNGPLQFGYLDFRRAEYLAEPDVPMYGRAWDFGGVEYGVAAYSKPVLALHTLENILGEEVMLDIMSTYFQRYRFAHPDTEDFRAVAEEVSGQNLDWFFDGVVYGDGVLNASITGLTADSVTIGREGDLHIPTELLVTFADGSTALEQWDAQTPEETFTYPDRLEIRSAELDPHLKIALDTNWSDNGLSRRPDLNAWAALTTRLLYTIQDLLLILGGL
jgi:hypothetical protein